jgi:hypothetical protein
VTLSGAPPTTPEPIGPGGPKQRSGCLVGLYVILGLGMLLIVVGGIAFWLFLRSDEGQRMLAAARQGVEWAEEAAQAPGTAELREFGCETAVVTTFDQMLELAAELFPEEAGAELEENPLADETLVLCMIGFFSDAAVDCAGVARVYGAAVPDAPERFVVMTQKQGRGKGECQGFFAPDGRFLGELGSEP